jgi:hypothetical protein
MEEIYIFEMLAVGAGIVGIWVKHQNDYAALKSRVKTLELKEDENNVILKQLAADIAEIKLILARKQIDR